MNTIHVHPHAAPQPRAYVSPEPTPRFLRLALPYLAIVPIAMGAILLFPFFAGDGVPSRLVFAAMVPFGAAVGYLIQIFDRQTWK